jgi:chemotaxis protein CheX
MTTTYTSQIEEITQSIFATMLDTQLIQRHEPWQCEGGDLLATIQITGEFMGSVVLELSHAAARISAARMLGAQPDTVTDADQRDVAAELVNMIGGNLKSMLPGPSMLSLPTVIDGPRTAFEIKGAQLCDDVDFDTDGGPLSVRFYGVTCLRHV